MIDPLIFAALAPNPYRRRWHGPANGINDFSASTISQTRAEKDQKRMERKRRRKANRRNRK